MLVVARACQKRKLLALLNVVPGARWRRSFVARRFVQNMLLLRRPKGDSPFEIPEDLARTWHVNRCRKAAPIADRADVGTHRGPPDRMGTREE